jgi:hypothetical protein
LKTCRSNLVTISLGLEQYASTHGTFLAGTVANDRLPIEERLSWLIPAFAFMDQLT